MVIRRVGARYWLAFLIVSWGCIVLGIGFIDDWRSLIVLRTFLGVFEAGCTFADLSWMLQDETNRT